MERSINPSYLFCVLKNGSSYVLNKCKPLSLSPPTQQCYSFTSIPENPLSQIKQLNQFPSGRGRMCVHVIYAYTDITSHKRTSLLEKRTDKPDPTLHLRICRCRQCHSRHPIWLLTNKHYFLKRKTQPFSSCIEP